VKRLFAYACVLVIGTATGCTWVKPSAKGALVREGTADEVASCQRVGTASGTTQTSVVLPRDKDVIRREQVTLAQNQAAVLGGDTIVADGPPDGGTQAFVVYRCQ
jgi:hypothetical protein